MRFDARDQSDLTPESDSELDSMLRKVARVDETLAAEAALPKLGDLVGDKYRIDGQLGRGGMGVVYRATHLVSEKPVAIKWMLRSPMDAPSERRFLREARAAGRIDHPNVVDVYDVGRESTGAYLVMELLHGEPLRKRLARGPLAPETALALLLPAMRGVAAAHRSEVVHRDLKPDNIFLCTGPDGEPREAKVLDFGICTVLAGTQEGAPLTNAGTILGTPAYMAPEQIEPAQKIDARADIYAFGVILYEALTGAPPFHGDSLSALAFAVVHKTPEPVSQRCTDVPAYLERSIMRALAKRPEDRYASMDDFIAELSGPEHPAASAPAPKASLPLMAAGVAAIVLAIVPLVSLFTDGTKTESSQLPASAKALPSPFNPGYPPAAPVEDEPKLLPSPPSAANVHSLPATCEQARSRGQSKDGLRKIDPDGAGPIKPFDVMCAGMTVSGREYLPLAAAGQLNDLNTTHFSYRGGTCPCPDLSRRFSHVRIDPHALTVDPTDGTFAIYDRTLTCESQHRNQCGEVINLSWGGAGSCRAPGDKSGTASIDLRHTPFALAPEVRFVPAGFGAAGSATVSNDRKTAKLVGGGQCGSIVSETATVPLAQVR